MNSSRPIGHGVVDDDELAELFGAEAEAAALLSAHAVDEEQAAVQGCLSHSECLRVFGGVIPALQLLHGRELDHDDPLASRPVPFWHPRIRSSHEVPPAITSDRCTRQLAIALGLRLIQHLNFRDRVGRHGLIIARTSPTVRDDPRPGDLGPPRQGRAKLRRRFAGEDGEVELVAPFALEPFVFDQVRLLSHADST